MSSTTPFDEVFTILLSAARGGGEGKGAQHTSTLMCANCVGSVM
jgi:hypothetical protein